MITEIAAITVKQLNFYVKSLLEGDSHLQSVTVTGELSNFKNHYASGHWYFTLKDGDAAVRCVMFRAMANSVRFDPHDGDTVVLRGRGQAILKANRVLIPLATLLYVGMCLWIIFTHAERIGTIGEQILREAFDFSAAASGGSGFALSKAVRYGVSRGIFSHEAGMGSAPLSYASAPVSDPARQGLMGVAEVFVDTFLVCMLTAFALLIIGIDGYGQDGMTLMMAAFSRAIGPAGPALIVFFIVLFAFPCVLGWYYYASVCLTYLSGSTLLADGYRLSFLLMIAAGAMLSGSLIWEISDLLNGCMTVLNLAALFLARRLTDP